jgi:predicted chitinase
MMDAVGQFEIGHHGIYPVTFDRRFHGGIHLNSGEQTEPVRASADGEVVAYRVCKNALSDGSTDPATGQPLLNSNAAFVLLKHRTDTGDGRTITYYSLYMHLLDMTSQEHIDPQPTNPPETGSANALPKWLLDTAGGKDGVVQPGGTKKVYRKDMLGYVGQHQGVAHLHFEIFMADADFTAWFEQDGHRVQFGEKNLVQPQSGDYWGHSYFVIHGPKDFVPQPAGMDASWFPKLPGGSIGKDDTLYVEAGFNKGRRYTRAWIDRGNSGNVILLTPDPIADPYDNDNKQYEYDLYNRATALYPACPSDGYEMLRFGRILSDHPTLSGAACDTWVAVPFDENGTQGYVNIAREPVIKLSDADFPFFTGWQKVDDDNTPFNQDGLCGYDELCRLTGVPDPQLTYGLAQPLEYDKNNNDSANQQLAGYLQTAQGVREKLKGLVCKARSEWDPSGNDHRYKALNEPDGFFGKQKDTNPDGYTKFIDFLSRFQFLDKTPLAGQKLWFFHPLAFIRHFRKCGWLSVKELTQCLPRKVIDQTKNGAHQTVYPTSTLRWSVAHDRADRFAQQINIALRKYGISISGLRTAYFLGNAIQETIYLSRTSELGGAQAHYAPWYGRGVIQLTFEENYKRYGDFRKWSGPPSGYRDSLDTDLSRACDSAGFYWVSCAKPVSSNHNINTEADKLPRFTVTTLINVCSDYDYHAKSCRTPLSSMEFRVSSEFEKSARAVNTGNPDSTGTLNGLMPRMNVFLASVATISDMLINYTDACSQRE